MGEEVKCGIVRDFAELPDRTLIDEPTLAGILGCSERTVQNMVARFDLPPPLDVAGRKRWFVGRLVLWLTSRAEREEQTAERKAERMGARS